MKDEPPLLVDPRNRQEIDSWRDRREQLYPGEPLTAREYLMLQRLHATRFPYSIT